MGDTMGSSSGSGNGPDAVWAARAIVDEMIGDVAAPRRAQLPGSRPTTSRRAANQFARPVTSGQRRLVENARAAK